MLRKLLDSLEPTFKHGPLKRFYPFFEAADTFLYTPGTKTQSGPHVRDGIDLKRTMISVVIALLPCTLFGMWNVGYQSMHAADPSLTPGAANFFEAFKIGLLAFLPIYVVTLAVGGTLEAIFAVVRKHEINEGFLVTSLLFPLILPPTIPLWQVGLGIAFGVVVGKEIFGGTGMNILNPALTARLFLYIAYPAQISGDVVWIGTAGGKWADGFSGATPLADFYNTGVTHVPYMDAFLGFIPGCIGETSVVACLLGAAYLIFAKVGSWRIMLSCLLGLIATGLLFNALSPSPEHYLAVTPWWHLAVGGFAFGAVFMATDPVSAAQTNTGRWIYGFLIGALTAVVRVLNPAYPEGIMLAIIFMNVFAPTIDYYVTKANIKRREPALEFSNRYILSFALVICLVCALGVSSAAVALRAPQQANLLLYKQQNVLRAVGALGEDEKATPDRVKELFSQIQQVVIDRKTGKVLDETPESLDLDKMSRDPEHSEATGPTYRDTLVKRVPDKLLAYEVHIPGKEGIVLPIRGYGLWSTLYGFLALSPDGLTVKGITYYEHGETPGLGGEVENPSWKAQWPGKETVAPDGKVLLEVVKYGTVHHPEYQVDGISGATITSKGVSGMIHLWLGDMGYGPYLETKRQVQ